MYTPTRNLGDKKDLVELGSVDLTSKKDLVELGSVDSTSKKFLGFCCL